MIGLPPIGTVGVKPPQLRDTPKAKKPKNDKKPKGKGK